MVERLVRIQKVRGSIPLISILSVFHSLVQMCRAFLIYDLIKQSAEMTKSFFVLFYAGDDFLFL